jgi:hypothetical protein
MSRSRTSRVKISFYIVINAMRRVQGDSSGIALPTAFAALVCHRGQVDCGLCRKEVSRHGKHEDVSLTQVDVFTNYSVRHVVSRDRTTEITRVEITGPEHGT